MRRLVYHSCHIRHTHTPTIKEYLKPLKANTNYLLVADEGMEFHLGDHKTSGFHGTYTRAVPKELEQVLRLYIDKVMDWHYDPLLGSGDTVTKGDDYLFVDNNGKPYNSHGFGQYLQRNVFKCYDTNLEKKLGVQKLRPIIVSGCPAIAERNERLKQLLAVSERDAVKRGHTCLTELAHYYFA